MKLEIVGQHLAVTDEVAMHVKRRLQFALGRFGSRILQVTVTLTDLSKSREDVNKQCCMIASILPQGQAVVETNDGEILLAIDRAAERLGRVLARELERRREQRIRKPEVTRIPAAALFRRQQRFRQDEGGLR